MFASKIASELALSAKRYVLGLLGWILIAPLAWVVPKRRNSVAVIGRESGKFVDNAKYFFLQARQEYPDIEFCFITELESVADSLRAGQLPVRVFAQFKTLWFLLRCPVVVVDSVEWSSQFRRHLLVRARVVQLWHGVGFKRIELDKWKHEAKSRSWMSSALVGYLRMAQKTISGRWLTYDAVCTTSAFYRDNVFIPAFKSRHFLVSGYPRNTFARVSGDLLVGALTGEGQAIYSRISSWRNSGRRVVLFAPTFRDTRSSTVGLNPEVVAQLDEFCRVQDVEMIFKFHPLERGASLVAGEHLHCLPNDIDLYPFFEQFDALITDYSSIYMDYLLVDKPVLFFVPDFDEYTRVDRQFQFDYHQMTPGRKLEDWSGLMDALLSELAADSCREQRQALKALAFDGLSQGASVATIIRFVRERGWLR